MVNSTDPGGRTPLHWYSHVSKAGSPGLRLVSNMVLSPPPFRLSRAAWFGNDTCARFLTEHGAKIRARTNFGYLRSSRTRECLNYHLTSLLLSLSSRKHHGVHHSASDWRYHSPSHGSFCGLTCGTDPRMATCVNERRATARVNELPYLLVPGSPRPSRDVGRVAADAAARFPNRSPLSRGADGM